MMDDELDATFLLACKGSDHALRLLAVASVTWGRSGFGGRSGSGFRSRSAFSGGGTLGRSCRCRGTFRFFK